MLQLLCNLRHSFKATRLNMNIDFLGLLIAACPIKGQVRKECASDPRCHQRCDPIPGPPICPLICIGNGCECPAGTIIDAAINECVAPNECTGTYTINNVAKRKVCMHV